MVRETLTVPSMNCGHCKMSIEGALTKLAGVKSVAVDVQRRTVDVEYDSQATPRPAIVAAIEEQGYDVAY